MGLLQTERTKLVHVLNAVAAGTTDQNTSSVDMSAGGGFRSVRFIADIGALTAGQATSLRVQGSTDNAVWNDLAGSDTGGMADADSNKLLVVDVNRPIHRYLRATVKRATQNAVINSVVAELYDPITEPTTQDATVSKSKQLVSPALGAA